MIVEQKVWLRDSGWKDLTNNNLAKKAQLVLIFGDREVLKGKDCIKEIKGFYPKADIIGCSTSGEILGTQVNNESISLTAVNFQKTKIKIVKTKINQMEDSRRVGEELVEMLDKDDLRHIFILSEGLNVNGSELSKGLVNNLSDDVAVTGGLAGDQDVFQETVVVVNEDVERDTIAAIGFYGKDIKIGYGSKGGWDSFGPDRLVTRSKGNVLYELDNKSALELYKEYLGEKANGLPATGLLFPLSMKTESEDDDRLVRTILAVNEEEGSMTFAGDIPEGSYVRLMKSNVERLVDGANSATNDCFLSTDISKVELAILISCVGRKLVLKQRVEEEVETVLDRFGSPVAMTGFYSYGEICPNSPEKKCCELHNQTMTITTFSEE